MAQQFNDPKTFAIDTELISPPEHFKLLITHLEAYKNDYVSREIKAKGMSEKYKKGLPQGQALEVKNVFDRYDKERIAFGHHIVMIREIMLEVWEKMSKPEQAEFAEYRDELANAK